MAKVRARDLIGRKIVGVEFRRFKSMPDSNPRATATDPALILDNGRRLYFLTQETEVGEYGVELCLSSRPAVSNA